MVLWCKNSAAVALVGMYSVDKKGFVSDGVVMLGFVQIVMIHSF